MFKIVPK